jgi:hypothetical protein
MRKLPPLLLCLTAIFLLATAASGQIRLHDASNDELAKKTRDAFADFSKGDANVFETMTSNTLSLKAATLAHLYELNQQGTRDAVNLIPVETWTELEGHVRTTQDDLLFAYNTTRKLLDPHAAQAANLKAALAQAKAELVAKTTLREEKAAALDGAQPKLKSLIESLDKLKDKLAASSKPINKLSELTAEFNNLKSVWTSIGEVKTWWEQAEKASHAPGLQLTILDAAVAHQQAEVDRLKLDLEQAEAAQKRAERIEQRLELVLGTTDKDPPKKGLFQQVFDGIGTVPNKNEQVMQTIGRLATEAEKEVGKPLDATMKLRNLLDILGRYTTLAGYHKYLVLSDVIEAGTDELLFSIRRSSLNTKERELLVSYGLDGLVAYHAGGIRPEQIANFFRAAQTIALGVMAGRD